VPSAGANAQQRLQSTFVGKPGGKKNLVLAGFGLFPLISVPGDVA